MGEKRPHDPDHIAPKPEVRLPENLRFLDDLYRQKREAVERQSNIQMELLKTLSDFSVPEEDRRVAKQLLDRDMQYTRDLMRDYAELDTLLLYVKGYVRLDQGLNELALAKDDFCRVLARLDEIQDIIEKRTQELMEAGVPHVENRELKILLDEVMVIYKLEKNELERIKRASTEIRNLATILNIEIE